MIFLIAWSDNERKHCSKIVIHLMANPISATTYISIVCFSAPYLLQGEDYELQSLIYGSRDWLVCAVIVDNAFVAECDIH